MTRLIPILFVCFALLGYGQVMAGDMGGTMAASAVTEGADDAMACCETEGPANVVAACAGYVEPVAPRAPDLPQVVRRLAAGIGDWPARGRGQAAPERPPGRA